MKTTRGKEESKDEKPIDEALKEKDCKLYESETDGHEESTGESESPELATQRVNEEIEGVQCLMLTEPDTAKQRAIPEQIVEEGQSEAEKTNAKGDDANGEFGEVEKKRTGCKEETEIDNCNLQEEIFTSVELKEAEGEWRQRAQISENMVPKPGNVQGKRCGIKTRKHESETERAQSGKQSEDQNGIQESTLNDVPADDVHHCKDVPAVNKTDASPADSQRNKKQWKFNRRSSSKTDSRRKNTAPEGTEAKIFEGQKG